MLIDMPENLEVRRLVPGCGGVLLKRVPSREEVPLVEELKGRRLKMKEALLNNRNLHHHSHLQITSGFSCKQHH